MSDACGLAGGRLRGLEFLWAQRQPRASAHLHPSFGLDAMVMGLHSTEGQSLSND